MLACLTTILLVGGAVVAGAMAERIAGSPSRELVERLVFAPIGAHKPSLTAARSAHRRELRERLTIMWSYLRKRVVKTGRIRTAEEYRLIAARAEAIYADPAHREELEILNALLAGADTLRASYPATECGSTAIKRPPWPYQNETPGAPCVSSWPTSTRRSGPDTIGRVQISERPARVKPQLSSARRAG